MSPTPENREGAHRRAFELIGHVGTKLASLSKKFLPYCQLSDGTWGCNADVFRCDLFDCDDLDELVGYVSQLTYAPTARRLEKHAARLVRLWDDARNAGSADEEGLSRHAKRAFELVSGMQLTLRELNTELRRDAGLPPNNEPMIDWLSRAFHVGAPHKTDNLANSGDGEQTDTTDGGSLVSDRRLDAIPDLDTENGEWITAVALANSTETNTGALGTTRGNGLRCTSKQRGIDPKDRIWRKHPNTGGIWYLNSSLDGKTS